MSRYSQSGFDDSEMGLEVVRPYHVVMDDVEETTTAPQPDSDSQAGESTSADSGHLMAAEPTPMDLVDDTIQPLDANQTASDAHNGPGPLARPFIPGQVVTRARRVVKPLTRLIESMAQNHKTWEMGPEWVETLV